jgi:hypothetical protein
MLCLFFSFAAWGGNYCQLLRHKTAILGSFVQVEWFLGYSNKA